MSADPNTTKTPVRSDAPIRFVAWAAVAWGLIGGWQILGEWWPNLNVVTKDQLTIIIASMIICGWRK